MDVGRKALLIVFWFLLLQPAAALTWTWWRHRKSADPLDRFSAALLALTTASYVFLWLAGVLYRPLLGPDYSNRLYITIESNLAINVLLAIIGGVRGGPWRRRVCLSGSSGLVAFAWFCVLAVNTAV
jgi:hypothetical protein